MVQTDTATRYAITAILILLLLIGLPWNVLIIASIIKKRLYKQPTIILLLNLAITDLLVCLLVMPLNIVTGIAGGFIFGASDRVRCQVCQTGVIFTILILVSLFNLAIISVDRFIFIKAAMHYKKWITPIKMVIATILIWVLSILVSIPALVGFGEMRFSTAVGICTIAFSGETHITSNSNYLIFLAIVAVIPILTLAITNIWALCLIQKYLRKKKKSMKETKLTHRKSFHKEMRKKHNVMQVKLVKIYTAIFVTNIITWLPMLARLVIGAVEETDEYSQAVRISGSLAYIALISQSVVHPIVQASLIGDVRKNIKAFFKILKKKVVSSTQKESSNDVTQGKEEELILSRSRCLQFGRCCECNCLRDLEDALPDMSGNERMDAVNRHVSEEDEETI